MSSVVRDKFQYPFPFIHFMIVGWFELLGDKGRRGMRQGDAAAGAHDDRGLMPCYLQKWGRRGVIIYKAAENALCNQSECVVVV